MKSPMPWRPSWAAPRRDRAALMLAALADRNDFGLAAGPVRGLETGPKQVRIAAIGVIGTFGRRLQPAHAVGNGDRCDAELAQAAKTALARSAG